MSETLEEFAREHLEAAKKTVRKGRELTPCLIFDAPDNTRGIVAVPNYHAARDEARHVMSELLKDKGAERYCFIMEAWMGSPGAKNDPNYLPSRDPNREECICVSAQDDSGAKLLIVAEIKRGKGGLVQFKDRNPDLGIFMGPLGDLFHKDVRQ